MIASIGIAVRARVCVLATLCLVACGQAHRIDSLESARQAVLGKWEQDTDRLTVHKTWDFSRDGTVAVNHHAGAYEHFAWVLPYEVKSSRDAETGEAYYYVTLDGGPGGFIIVSGDRLVAPYDTENDALRRLSD